MQLGGGGDSHNPWAYDEDAARIYARPRAPAHAARPLPRRAPPRRGDDRRAVDSIAAPPVPERRGGLCVRRHRVPARPEPARRARRRGGRDGAPRPPPAGRLDELVRRRARLRPGRRHLERAARRAAGVRDRQRVGAALQRGARHPRPDDRGGHRRSRHRARRRSALVSGARRRRFFGAVVLRVAVGRRAPNGGLRQRAPPLVPRRRAGRLRDPRISSPARSSRRAPASPRSRPRPTRARRRRRCSQSPRCAIGSGSGSRPAPGRSPSSADAGNIPLSARGSRHYLRGMAENRLAREASPYLLQHADNPVDWYPWGPEALEKAQARGQADPALHRLRGLPLVPRDGARVVRGPATSRR